MTTNVYEGGPVPRYQIPFDSKAGGSVFIVNNVIFDCPDNVTLRFFTFVGKEPGAKAGVEPIDRNEGSYIFRVRDSGKLVIRAS